MHLENGNIVTINAPANSDDNIYIRNLYIDGKEYKHNYLLHDRLMQGVTIDAVMSDTPNKKRGVAEDDAPYSFSRK